MGSIPAGGTMIEASEFRRVAFDTSAHQERQLQILTPAVFIGLAGMQRSETDNSGSPGAKQADPCAGAQTTTATRSNVVVRAADQSPAGILKIRSIHTSPAMNITLNLIPIVSLIAGILIFIMPRLLSTIVAIYLIMVGLVGLFGNGSFLR